MDGTETHGSSSVTVITKYGRHTRFTFFEVWAPQIPVEVALSDNMLSQIKGWKVLSRQASSRCLLITFTLFFDDRLGILTVCCSAIKRYVAIKNKLTHDSKCELLFVEEIIWKYDLVIPSTLIMV